MTYTPIAAEQTALIYRLFSVKDVRGTRFAGWSANPDLDTLTSAAATDLITELSALPELATADGCRCWANTYALGHEGHCCFLRDDRNRRIDNGFKAVEDICHVPAPESLATEVAR